VAVLRDDDAAGPLEPQPGLAGLPGLVDAMRAAGLEVEVGTTGAARPLPAGLDLAAYRVVQEGLTNVRRHSASGHARVQLSFGAEVLQVEVHDSGPQVPTPPESGGHGLVGIRERAVLYGGRMSAGPDGRGGFRLCVELAAAP
jgi:signal transduction histidine kinase